MHETKESVQGGLTEAEKRLNVIRLAFGGSEDRFEAFCRAIREEIPGGTRVILRGSAVTGARWRDGSPFDADGPGTSDLDLTLVGDFNTLAPGELLDIRKLPHRLRALVWLSGGQIRWRTIQTILDAGYIDAFRHLQPDLVGCTFPTWDPHARLDYLFVPGGFIAQVRTCEVATAPPAADASDHFPFVAELAVE